MIRKILAAAGLALALTQAAQAQRPVITQDVDEPGRAPYQSFAQVVSCSAGCSVVFAPVPAGKRLVVTYLSAIGVGNIGRTSLFGIGDPSSAQIEFFLGTDLVTGLRTFHEPVTFYVEAGNTPTIFSSTGNELRGTLVGYLVSIP